MKNRKLFLLLVFIAFTLTAFGIQDSPGYKILFEKAKFTMETKGDLNGAINLFNDIIKKYPKEREYAAKSQLYIGLCYEKLGVKEAQIAYQKVINSYPEQTEAVKAARDKLSALQRVQALVEKADDVLKLTKIYENAEKVFGFLSPDGKKLALVGSEGDIWVKQVDSGKEIRLTHTPNFKYWCSWSPDGETIAYLDVSNVLYVVPAKGGEPKPLIVPDSDFIKKGNSARMTGWTKDSQMIICQVSKRGLCAIPLSGGEWKDLFKFTDPKQEEEFGEITLSPDGKFIAYGSKKSGNSDIYVMPTNGGQSVQITNHPASDWGPSWSFDGKWISFLSTRSGDREIWVIGISPDGHPQGEPSQVYKGLPVFNSFFNWINDGKIGISMNPTIQNVFISDLETGKETQLTNILADDRSPRWSPDGRQIAFVSYRDNKSNLWVIPSGGGVAKKVTLNVPNPDGSCYLTRPSWLPDGKSLAFGGFFGKDHGIWIVPSGGGVPQLKKFDFEVMASCDASPDGLYIAFDNIGLEKGDSIKGSRTFESGIYVIPFKGGVPKRMTKTEKNGLIFSSPCWSPDGKLIAFRSTNRLDKNEGKESDEIWVGGFPDGEPKPITKKMAGNLTYLSWAPDKKTIIFSMSEKNRSQIYSVPAEGGEVKKMNIEGNSPDFSPDGKKIAYVKNKSKVECWLVENFLPKEVPENKEFSIKKISDAFLGGAISPDGRYLSYMDEETGDLAIYEIATGKKSRLTTNNSSWDEYVESSRWSPNGKQIVYAWYNKNDYIDLCIIGVDGSKPRILYSNKENNWAKTFDWSPDGKHILSCLKKSDGQYQMVLVSTTDGSVQILKILEHGWPSNMNFSPDGRYIVYDFKLKEDTQERDISILPIDGSREIPLVEHPADDYVLGWAPDGKNILFTSDRRNSTDAWVIQFSDGKVQGIPILVKANIGKIYPMGFTKKGSFCYIIVEVLRDIYFAELDPETNKMLVPPKKQTSRFEGSLYQPEYSPDGKYIAYISAQASHSASLSIQSLETGKMQEFPSNILRNMASPRWSPDGRSILVGGWDWKGKKGIWRIDTQSGIYTLIVPPANDTENFYFLTTHGWSRDGKAIFLGRLSNKQAQIMLREIESGTEKELYRGSGNLVLSCSPDGKWLALMNKGTEGFLKIMSADGGEPRELYRFKKEDNLFEIRWTPDGKYILLYKDQPPVKNFNWWRIPMEGGEPQKLGLDWDTFIYTSFHPDGRHIVFSTHDSKSENTGNYIMENFLPK